MNSDTNPAKIANGIAKSTGNPTSTIVKKNPDPLMTIRIIRE
jgi:hypothetical protein